jgi:hypothetical protein
MDVRIEIEQDHVHVFVGGEFDVAAARDGIVRIVDTCRRSGLQRVLIDGRGIDSTVSVLHRQEIALTLALEKAPAHLRMAIVVSRDNMFTKALEQTCAKMKIDVRTTESMAEALVFLGLPIQGAPGG